MNEYDVRKAFEEMELELIASMKRNFQRHLDWEKDEGFNWNMWQVEQLKTLENFKKENKKVFNKKCSSINALIADFIEKNYRNAAIKEELGILDQLARGEYVKGSAERGLGGSFFSLNKNKMQALINATTNDMKKAEYAMLRMTNDQYRKIIFNAQVMANSGAFTLEQAIDKASRNFLSAGINCIQYKDGRRVNIASYAEMAIRTANKRAVLISEGDVRKGYGISTVRISRYGQCSETCLPWQGKVYVDDVYSGGTKEEAEQKNLQLLSVAIAGGLFHPNCKHRATTYFYDLKKSLGKLEEDGVEVPPEEQEHRKNNLHIQQQKRIATGSLDPQNVKIASARQTQWEKKDELLGIDDLQTYKKVELGEERVISSLGHGVFTTNKVITYKDVYLSTKAKIKPKELHDLNKRINQAMLDFKVNPIYKPKIVIYDSLEQNAFGFYNPIDNTIFMSSNVVNKEAMREYGGVGWTEYHEMYHLKQWSKFFEKGIKINESNYKKYRIKLINNSRETIEKLKITEYNVSEISSYASKSFLNGFYDEVEADYMVSKILKRGGK